jgi:hypothetical protein
MVDPQASRPPPPKKKKKKPLTTSGGVRNTTYPQKNRFPQFVFKIIHFCMFSMSSSEADSGKMEMYFKKPREFFV